MDNIRLETMLRSLTRSVDWPGPSPYLEKHVVASIEAERGLLRRPGRRRLAIATVAALVVTALVVVSPTAREAAADLFQAAGIRIGFTSEQTPDTGADLGLGQPVDLDDLRRAVDFAVRVPAVAGPPDSTYLSSDGRVTMVWQGSQALPAAEGTDVALLLTQGETSALEVFAQKLLGPGTQIRSLNVEGSPALWIEGAPHTLTFVDSDGNPTEETTRLAANVLLWEVGGVDYRLETTGDLASALAVAESLRGGS